MALFTESAVRARAKAGTTLQKSAATVLTERVRLQDSVSKHDIFLSHAYSRLVVGWAIAERMTAELPCQALKMALWRRRMPKEVIVHSDRGSQYCSAQYQTVLTQHSLICSMSAKGNCYDNACAESFFHTMKVEIIHGERFATREEMRQTVFEYIEVDYNRTRRHSANGCISPEVFEIQQAA